MVAVTDSLFIAGISSFLVFTLLTGAGFLLITLLILVFLYRYRQMLMSHWPKRSWAQIGVVTVGVLLGVFVYSQLGEIQQGFYQAKVGNVDMASQSYESVPAGAPMARGKNYAAAEAELSMDMSEGSIGGGSGTIPTGDYKGLPAKIKIPDEGRMITFNQGMIDTETTPALKLLLIDRGISACLLVLGLFGLGFILYRRRSEFSKLLSF